MTIDPFADKMERIADMLADQVLAGDTSDETIAAFKALSLYLVQTRKLGRKHGDDADENWTGFRGIKATIAAVENGRDAEPTD